MAEKSEKKRVILVYTGEGKGKTSASLGLTVRALGAGYKVAFIQFIKLWDVSEHAFIQKIMPLFDDSFDFYKGGLGFFEAGDLSSAATEAEHREHARTTFEFALQSAKSGSYQLVVCDEINNAVHEGLLTETDLKQLIAEAHPSTSLCLTGRDFLESLLPLVDIATEMKKLKHHYDDGFIANKGIDY
ncbi:MAG: cob(I)yrinic acid a,c-diamide adenosyltransferase [Candidatus Saccharimonadales bacterium]